MTIQEQLRWDQVNDEALSIYKAIGVDYLTVYPPPELHSRKENTDYFKETRKLAESHGLILNNVAYGGADEFTLGLPNCDEKIEEWCDIIRSLGEAGIPTIGYNFKPIGNFRTKSDIGRGGVSYSTFVYDELMADPPDVPDKHITEEKLWGNLQHFLHKVIPVAEESGVRMALHPDDPPIPEPIGGAARIVSTLDQYQRIFDEVPSDSNAMLFCQGCVAEMGENIPGAIRRIGSQNKIVYVHFRNIRGTPKDFREVFLDEGDVDMLEAMKTYKEIGFEGPFMMDHTPNFPQPGTTFVGRAFAVGFIRATIQAVY